MRAWSMVLFLLLPAACTTGTPDSGPSCVERYPTTGDPAVDFPDQAAARSSTDCVEGGGTDCAVSGFISQAAAVCLADEYGLDSGLTGRSASMTWHYDYKTVVWDVMNTTHVESDVVGGDMLVIHATTGALLETGGWEQYDDSAG